MLAVKMCLSCRVRTRPSMTEGEYIMHTYMHMHTYICSVCDLFCSRLPYEYINVPNPQQRINNNLPHHMYVCIGIKSMAGGNNNKKPEAIFVRTASYGTCCMGYEYLTKVSQLCTVV